MTSACSRCSKFCKISTHWWCHHVGPEPSFSRALHSKERRMNIEKLISSSQSAKFPNTTVSTASKSTFIWKQPYMQTSDDRYFPSPCTFCQWAENFCCISCERPKIWRWTLEYQEILSWIYRLTRNLYRSTRSSRGQPKTENRRNSIWRLSAIS